jgi:hypothetical protein
MSSAIHIDTHGTLVDVDNRPPSTSVFRANPFSVNDEPCETISESIINGQHGPLLYPPIILEFSLWDDLPYSPCPPKVAIVVGSPSAKRTPTPLRKLRRSGGHTPPLLSASSSSSFPPSVPTTPQDPTWPPDILSYHPPFPYPLVWERRTSTSTDHSFTLPNKEDTQPSCRLEVAFWLPSSLVNRKNARKLQPHPPFLHGTRSSSAKLNLQVPTLLGLLSQTEQDSEYPYHPCEVRVCMDSDLHHHLTIHIVARHAGTQTSSSRLTILSIFHFAPAQILLYKTPMRYVSP